MDMSHHECYYAAVAMRRRILAYIAANPEADYNDMICSFIAPLVADPDEDGDGIELVKAQAEGVSIGMELAGEVTFIAGRLAAQP
jgi:hypothetical protein